MTSQEQKAIEKAFTEVAERYAHKLALDLECVLSDYNGKWYDTAMQTISDYRSAMNSIHEQIAPTHMGEPLIPLKKVDAIPGTSEVTQEMVDTARSLIIKSGRVSISYVQRNMRIGYNQAARIVESLEKDGTVSFPSASGVREILRRSV